MNTPIVEGAAQYSPDHGLAGVLAGNFVAVNLGSGSDRDYALPDHLKRSLTLIEIDAGPKSKIGSDYYAKYSVSTIVAGTSGRATFRRHRFPYCSSLRQPSDDLIRQYGIEKYYEIVDVSEVECVTLPDLMKDWQLTSIDFLKTDLEGEDFEVIRSLDGLLDTVLAIQCELRFQPFYRGEPFFHEVASYLYANGFELIGLQPEYWKPKTQHRERHKDGRVVWADCIFLRTRDSVAEFPKDGLDRARAKQILISGMVGLRGYSEFLLEAYKDSLPSSWVVDLESASEPRRKSMRERVAGRLATRLYSRIVEVMKSSGFDFVHVVKGW